jgi:hypothetical protein
MATQRRNRARTGLALAALALATIGCTGTAQVNASGGTTGGTIAPVTRDVLGQAPAPEAPGFDQYLMKVTIQGGVKLPAHHHPGTQVSRIEEGELTYTLVSGSAKVARNGAGAPTEEVKAPDTVILRAGDTVYETESLVHYGENKGTARVVVLMSALLESGEPVSINVDN